MPINTDPATVAASKICYWYDLRDPKDQDRIRAIIENAYKEIMPNKKSINFKPNSIDDFTEIVIKAEQSGGEVAGGTDDMLFEGTADAADKFIKSTQGKITKIDIF